MEEQHLGVKSIWVNRRRTKLQAPNGNEVFLASLSKDNKIKFKMTGKKFKAVFTQFF